MIWSIFKKDFCLLWRRAAVVGALQVMSAVFLAITQQTSEIDRWELSTTLLFIGIGGGMALLISSLVHHDVVPGNRQDWLVRPIPRPALVAAKILGVLLLVHAPMLLADITYGMLGHFSLGSTLAAAFSRNVFVFLVFSFPLLAIASLARNFIGTMAALLALLMASAGMRLLMDEFHWELLNFTDVRLLRGGPTWVAEASSLVVVTIGAAVVLCFQYRRRKTAISRMIVFGTWALAFALAFFLPWNVMFAVQQKISSSNNNASRVTVTFDPALGKRKVAARASNVDWRQHIPVRISGLPPNTALRIDLARARSISASAAEKPYSIDTRLDFTENGPSYLTLEMAAVSRLARDEPRNDQELRSKPFRLEVELYATLLHATGETSIDKYTLRADERRHSDSPCFIWLTSVDEAPYSSEDDATFGVSCRPLISQPPCVSLVVKDLPSPWTQRQTLSCPNGYRPYEGHLLPGGDDVRIGALILDGSNTRHFAGNNDAGMMLANATKSLRWYEPVAHFKQTLVVPSMNFEDWTGQGPAFPRSEQQ